MTTRYPALIALVTLGLALVAAPTQAAEEIRLKDGTVIRGEIVARDDSTLTVDAGSLGRLKLRRDDVVEAPATRRPESATPSRAASADPDPIGHALVLMPTAFLPPQGTLVFRDFELLFLTLGWSPTASTSIVAGAMFPITSEFNALTAGVKQGLYLSRDGATGLAVAGNITVPIGSSINEAGFLWLLNGVASHRLNSRVGMHGAVGSVGAEGRGEGVRSLSLAGGTDIRLTRNVKFLAEVLHGGTSLDPGSSLTLVNAGFRLHGDRLSADICAMRPVSDEFGDLWLIPLINVGYRF